MMKVQSLWRMSTLVICMRAGMDGEDLRYPDEALAWPGELRRLPRYRIPPAPFFSSQRTAPQALHLRSMSSFLEMIMSVSGLPHCPHCTNFLMKPSSSCDSLCVSCAPFTIASPEASSYFV